MKPISNTSVQERPCSTNDERVASYLNEAAGRPGFALWGKAQPVPEFDSAAHPLICHMVDVANVAELLVDNVLARGTTRRFLQGFGCSPDAARQWLPLLVALHDFGKASPAFQAKWVAGRPGLREAGLDLDIDSKHGRDHGTVGPFFLSPVLQDLGLSPTSAYRVARAVCAHHGSFPADDEVPSSQLGAALSQAISRDERGKGPRWTLERVHLVAELKKIFSPPDEVPAFAEDGDRVQWAFFAFLAGLTSVADWVGSMAHHFIYEVPPVDMRAYVDRSKVRASQAMIEVGLHRSSSIRSQQGFQELFGRSPRPLQALAVDLASAASTPLCTIVEAPMGEGKTEMAFYLAHALEASGLHEGMYIALPTQATANQMFSRLVQFLETTRNESTSAILVHGEANLNVRMRELIRAVYDKTGDQGLSCEHWFLGKKRSLLAPFGAGTIDQALLSVLRTKHAFVRQFGLAGKTVILDEVHAYDTYTSKLLDRLVSWLGAHGASVVILSATLPSARREEILRAYAGQPLGTLRDVSYPRVTTVSGSGVRVDALVSGREAQEFSLQWRKDEPLHQLEELTAELGGLLEDGGCICILRNTVNRAQKTYEALVRARSKGQIPIDTEFLLLHARFPADDRQASEQVLTQRLGPGAVGSDRPRRLVVVGTQVLEQSLDVDFDLMFSDLAPVDLLLQRAGRVHRHLPKVRPALLSVPRLIVIRPEGSTNDCSFKNVGIVYEDFVLRRTLQELEKMNSISIPNDIEPLVEAVYTSVPALEGKLLDELTSLDQQKRQELNLAKERAWPESTVADDPFANFRVPFKEDDPDVAQALRAETRLGEQSVAVICLFGSTGDAYFDRDKTRPVDLQRELSPSDIRALAGRTVKLSTRGLVGELLKLTVPNTLRSVAILADRRPLFFGEQPLQFGKTSLDLDPLLGVTIKSQAPSQTSSETEA